MIEAKYLEIDLGEFDDEYAGQKVRVWVNPTRAFRAEYNKACGQAIFGADDKAFLACLARVIDRDVNEAAAIINALPADAAQWLFFYTIDQFNGDRFEVSIPPRLYQIWDDWVVERVKARAARLPASATPASESQAAN